MTTHSVERFQSYEEWRNSRSANSGQVEHYKKINIEEIISRDGLNSPVLGKIPPEQVTIHDNNYRETVYVRGLNMRQRAVLELLADMPEIWKNRKARIYAPEAMTSLALYLRGRFPKFIGSEYADNDIDRMNLFPIQSENLMDLSFPDGIFNCVLSNDVLEHVPDITRSLSEMARITTKGGVLISTFPFTWKPDGLEKARLIGGKVKYLCEPEYHVNPISEKGSLVFTIPGWDILQKCRDAGYSHAEMVMIVSEPWGIHCGNWPYLNVLYAKR